MIRRSTILVMFSTLACSGADGGEEPPNVTSDVGTVDARGIPDAIDPVDTIVASDAPLETATDAVVDAPKPSGKLLFVGDFETGDLSQWIGVEQCAKGRITVYDASSAPTGAPAPKQGKYAARFHVLDTDVSPCTSTDNPRAQLSTALSLFKPGDDLWQHWVIYVPTTFPTIASGKWVLFQEDYGPPWDGPPQIGWNILPIKGVQSFAMNRGAQYGVDTAWSMPLVKGKWIDFLVHKKFTNTKTGGGFVEAFVDGSPIAFAPCGGCTKLDMQTMHSSQSALGFFQNLYRALGTAPTIDLYFDDIRIGTTREIVQAE